jgi:hypothetical protein
VALCHKSHNDNIAIWQLIMICIKAFTIIYTSLEVRLVG